MRIPDPVLKSVCFLCTRITGGGNAGRYQFIGTGFFVSVEQDNFGFCYLATAKHILDEARRIGSNTIYARINKLDGTADYVELDPLKDWVSITDNDVLKGGAVDLSLIAFAPDQSIFDVEAIPMEFLLTNEEATEQSIGVGDELFVVGLFTLHYGKKRNIPILRTGIISALFEEPLFDKQNRPYNAYLAELRSIGGLSGSPVFVALNNQRFYKPKIEHEHSWRIYLLGLIRGHWDLKRELSEDASNPTEDVPLGYSKGENLNVGIAVITPAQYVSAILTNPKLVEHRATQIQIMK